MVAGKDSYAVCGAFCSGILLMGILLTTRTMPLHTDYVYAGVLLPALLLWLMITLRTDSMRNLLWPWVGVFVMLGAFCMASRSVGMDLSAGLGAAGGGASLGAGGRLQGNALGGMLGDTIRGIPFGNERSNAFTLAIICGDKSMLSSELLADFRGSGAAHLLALSGMHLGIIYLIMRKLLSIFGNHPVVSKMRSVAIIAVTGAYTIGCGCGPSLLRAWLFITLYELAAILHRPQNPGQIFCSALIIHLALRPESALDLGFQLSYLAMVGIVFLWPRVRIWYQGEIMRRIWDITSMSLCCQLFTGPLSYLHFGTFPKMFLITNLIAAPLMGVVMCCAIAAILLYSTGINIPWLYTTLEYPISVLLELIHTINGISLAEHL